MPIFSIHSTGTLITPTYSLHCKGLEFLCTSRSYWKKRNLTHIDLEITPWQMVESWALKSSTKCPGQDANRQRIRGRWRDLSNLSFLLRSAQCTDYYIILLLYFEDHLSWIYWICVFRKPTISQKPNERIVTEITYTDLTLGRMDNIREQIFQASEELCTYFSSKLITIRGNFETFNTRWTFCTEGDSWQHLPPSENQSISVKLKGRLFVTKQKGCPSVWY